MIFLLLQNLKYKKKTSLLSSLVGNVRDEFGCRIAIDAITFSIINLSPKMLKHEENQRLKIHLRLLSVERRARSGLSERSNERSAPSRETGDSY